MTVFEEMERALKGLFIMMVVLLAIFVPLGVWKLLDLLGWVVEHVYIR